MYQELGKSSNIGSGAPLRPTQVESEINELRGANEELVKRCIKLRERLQSVLRQTAKVDPSANAPTPRDLLVPLAESIRAIRDNTREAISIISEINDDLEIPLSL